jgi:membrane-bound lytic murein transglycosylase B
MALKYSLLFICLLTFSNSFLAEDSIKGLDSRVNQFSPVIEQLLERGADSGFVYYLVSHPSVEFNERYVKINVTGYLNPPDYTSHYNDYSVRRTRIFYNNNLDLLSLAEQKYGVNKEVIAAVLWIETRHGNYLGNHHIVSVYLSAAMCNLPDYYNVNKQVMLDKHLGTKSELPELEQRLRERSDRKANWALDQLLALEKMHKVSPIPIMELHGSWAGAFGISQFLPVSYINWAVDGDGDKMINLFEVADAVFSTANYLNQNGWGETYEEQKAAVFHYNNSSAYVDAVLTLASLVSDEENSYSISKP